MRKSIERMELVHDFLKRAFSGSLHAKRILSLANGTLGVLTGASLTVSVIGHALAQARGLADRHAIKQVDRLLSNAGVVVWDELDPGFTTIGLRCEMSCSVATDGARNDEVTQEV